jgi:hypothetical protein
MPPAPAAVVSEEKAPAEETPTGEVADGEATIISERGVSSHVGPDGESHLEHDFGRNPGDVEDDDEGLGRDEPEDDSRRLEYDIPYSGPIRADSESYQCYPSMAQIREAAAAVGVESVSDEEIRDVIRPALFKWNTMKEEYRRNMLDGRDFIDHRGIMSHGHGAAETIENENVCSTLAKYGLVIPEALMLPRSSRFDARRTKVSDESGAADKEGAAVEEGEAGA